MRANPALALVEQGVSDFAVDLRQEVDDEHPHVQAAIDSFIDILQCGGKRTRGVLTVCGYEIFEGDNTVAISKASGAIEGLHAYLLVVDDVADQALTRRGRPAAHIAIQDFLQQSHSKGDTKQTSEDLAINAALTAQHKAQRVFAHLNLPTERRLTALDNVNRHLARTGVGQILDIASTTGMHMDANDIERVSQYKTAYYSFQLPLETGALLAGAELDELKPLAQYSLHAGTAFQLKDDILGTFGNQETMGKSPKSDLATGKHTSLMSHAFNGANSDQSDVLKQAWGNPELSDEDFARCQQIIIDTGALQLIENEAAYQAEKAHQALNTCPNEWPSEKINLLRDMASFAINRQS